MVYYGALSKGCQRCRQRKIKCDEGKPGCLKCAKSNRKCPGYRDLKEILFRDESSRIIGKARRVARSDMPGLPMSYALSQDPNTLAGNFFFARYNSFSGPPYCPEPDWLAQSYLEESPSNAIREVIEAVGLAAMSNISYAPDIAYKANQQYCRALVAMNQALDDPGTAIADASLMCVILLGLFEVVQSNESSRSNYWATHTGGALALLKLRGHEQFTRERGAQLFIQIRSQILLACMERNIAVPPALVETTCNFQTSTVRKLWKSRSVASPGSICEISFRLVNLQAAMAGGKITDPTVVTNKALDIDHDLQLWEASVPATWGFSVVDAAEAEAGSFLAGKRHVYSSTWVAEGWNNWRALRIVVNQLILRNERAQAEPDSNRLSRSRSIVCQLSTELCMSTSGFIGSPHILSLIQPLYLVSMETLNPQALRFFAAEQLHQIGVSMGVGQAARLAAVAFQRLKARDPPLSLHFTKNQHTPHGSKENSGEIGMVEQQYWEDKAVFIAEDNGSNVNIPKTFE
ncbi:hypothetical protein ARAM_001563 [Aspergillus rambellii]|uniref:Zn(2)-C6 fungal-type domain-containing protein n=1 Tax=Aspergillus rambellii TaxID=308745 RepID=A0A0F8V3G5_9EURO|nr:hypothetical protein ARAM_001563 [Aspergillus rambellii]